MGKRPLEAWQAVIDTLGLKSTAQQLYAESEPLLKDRQARSIAMRLRHSRLTRDVHITGLYCHVK
jgi:hypothetical protein